LSHNIVGRGAAEVVGEVAQFEVVAHNLTFVLEDDDSPAPQVAVPPFFDPNLRFPIQAQYGDGMGGIVSPRGQLGLSFEPGRIALHDHSGKFPPRQEMVDTAERLLGHMEVFDLAVNAFGLNLEVALVGMDVNEVMAPWFDRESVEAMLAIERDKRWFSNRIEVVYENEISESALLRIWPVDTPTGEREVHFSLNQHFDGTPQSGSMGGQLESFAGIALGLVERISRTPKRRGEH